MPNLNYCITDSLGQFIFLLDKYYNNKDIFLTINNDKIDRNDIKWELDKRYNDTTSNEYYSKSTDTSLFNYLSDIKKISLINKIFNSQLTVKKPVDNKEKLPARNYYLTSQNYVRYLAEYVEMVSFSEIASNILPGVKFKKNNNSYLVNTVDGETNPPLVLLNYIPCNNYQYIDSLDSKKINKIEVIRHKLCLGDVDLYGLLSIKTNDIEKPVENSYGNAILIKNILSDDGVGSTSTSNNNNQGNYPDFRHNIYWNPDVNVTGNNKLILEFNTSLLKAKYTVNIQGITDNGEAINSQINFEVK